MRSRDDSERARGCEPIASFEQARVSYRGSSGCQSRICSPTLPPPPPPPPLPGHTQDAATHGNDSYTMDRFRPSHVVDQSCPRFGNLLRPVPQVRGRWCWGWSGSTISARWPTCRRSPSMRPGRWLRLPPPRWCWSRSCWHCRFTGTSSAALPTAEARSACSRTGFPAGAASWWC